MTTALNYSNNAVYTAGQLVVIDGITYKANWWVSGQDPKTNSGSIGSGLPWTVVPEALPNSAPATPSTPEAPSPTAPETPKDNISTPGYEPSKVYTGGELVTINGLVYKANWWTRGENPSDNNGAIGTAKPWTIISRSPSAPVEPIAPSPVTPEPVTPPAPVVPSPVEPLTPPNVAPVDSKLYEYTEAGVFTSGQLVNSNGVTYKAKWWVSGQDPANSSGPGTPWEFVGPTSTEPPKTPEGLLVTKSAPSSAALVWKNGGGYVTTYVVYKDGIEIGRTANVNFSIYGLKPETHYEFSVVAVNSKGTSGESQKVNVTTPTGAVSTSNAIYAPYVDLTLNSGQFVVATAKEAGLKAITLAFIQSSGSGSLGWGGMGTLEQDQFSSGASITKSINDLQDDGVFVIVSFGGAAGQDPAAVALSSGQLQTQYQSVIDRYHVNYLDFDIEGAVMLNGSANQKRNAALTALEKANSQLKISFTLPVFPTGLTPEGLKVLKEAVAAGVSIDRVNIMAMDYGSSMDNGGDMGLSAIQAIQNTESQLDALGLSKTTIGVTPMIGINDVSSEIFTLKDAERLIQYIATDSRVSEVSAWSIARDNGAGAGNAWASATNSGLAQEKYQFSSIFNEVNK